MSVVFVVAEEKRNTHSHGRFPCGVFSLNIKTYFLWGVEDQKGRDPFWRSMHKLHLVRCVFTCSLIWWRVNQYSCR